MSNGVPLPNVLSTGEIVFLGAVGGFVVGVATYPVVDNGYVDLFVKADSVEWLGFILRIITTTLIGAFWGYIHRPDHDRKRAFQLGLVAPAALASLLYANNVGNNPTVKKTSLENVLPIAQVIERDFRFKAFGTAHAATLSDLVTSSPVAGPTDIERPFIERLVKGILGR